MNDLKTAAQQALEALVDAQLHNYALKHRETDRLITALRAALAEPEPFNPDWDRVEALQETLREHMAICNRLKAALAEADRIMGHDDAETEWRERWAHLFPGGAEPVQEPITTLYGTLPVFSQAAPPQRPAEPVQEPVAWVCYGSSSDEKHAIDYQQEDIDAVPVGTMLYTAPPQRKPLSDEEIDRITRDRWGTQLLGVMVQAHREYARAVEAAHGIGGSHE